MTTTRLSPQTVSYLNPNGWLFTIQKYPELNYFTQAAEVPSISISPAMAVSLIHDVKMPGDTMEYSDLSIQFLIDEKMTNWLAIYNWMTGLAFPENHTEFSDLINSTRNVKNTDINTKTVSDCVLTILDSDNLPVKSFTFVDAWPMTLSGIQVASTNTDAPALSATVTLAYSYYYLS